MTDNVKYQTDDLATPPPSTEVAADVIDGVAIQRVKVTLGDDGENTGDLSQRRAMPVTEEFAINILNELKIMNMQLALITDTIITKREID